MNVAFDIDFTITKYPKFFREALTMLDGLILTSFVREVGGKEKNVRYRVRQLRKLGIKGGDYRLIAIANGTEQQEFAKNKADLCEKLEVEILFEDDPVYIEECRKVCEVIQVKGPVEELVMRD